MSVRRKLAIATWAPPREGNIYGKLTVDAGPLLEYIDRVREESGEKVSVTHVVGAAVARALAQAPGLNGRILFGRYIPHDSVDVAFLVALEDGANLAKAKVENLDKKGVVDVARELRELAGRLRGGQDADFKKTMDTVKMLPVLLLRPLLWFTGWLASSLGVSARALGVERYPFGSCIITSVGMFGLDEGWAPPTPFARVPVYVLVGAVRERAAVVDGQIQARQELTLCATIDHRFLDGFQGGVLAKVVRRLLEHPDELGAPRLEAPVDGSTPEDAEATAS